MATKALGSLVQLLRQYRHHGSATTDGELLDRFIHQRDEDAFETLVHRHGRMVLGVCQRVLHNEADAEDCFQATFLVLVRKAATLRRRGMVGNWLHSVARNAALKAKAMRNLRLSKEQEAATEKARMSADHGQVAEVADTSATLQELLDQELESLPDRYRAAIVLCDLEGLTIADAARQVGCPQGTLNARLVRGRAMLAKRLARHGLAVSGAVLATALCQNAASACVPGPLVVSTVQAATLTAAGKALATGAISAKVVALTEGVLKAMLITKIKVALAVVLAIPLIGAGVGLVYCQTAGKGQDKQGKPAVAQEKPSSPVPANQHPTPKKDDAELLQHKRELLAGLQAGMTSDQVFKVLGKPDEIRPLTEGHLLDGTRPSGDRDQGPETERWAYGILGKGLFAKVGYVSMDRNGKVIVAVPADRCLYGKRGPFERVPATSDEAAATSSKMSCHLGPIEIIPPKGESSGAFKAKITLKNSGKSPFELKNDAVPFIDRFLLIELYDSTGTMLFREDNMSYHSPISL